MVYSDISPLFILGNPRSGTTLARLILTSHPLIHIPPESHFFLWLYEKYSSWNKESSVTAFLEDLYRCTKFETWNIEEKELQKFIQQYYPQTYGELIRLVYLFHSQQKLNTLRYWGDKNALWIEKIDIIHKLFPETKFIHIVRDGRDVACSYLELNQRRMYSVYAPRFPESIEEIAETWRKNVDFLIRFRSRVKKQNFFVIKYEALLDKPEEVIKSICRFLNVGFTRKMLTYYENNRENQLEPPEFLQWKEKINSPFIKENAGKYRNILTNSQIEQFTHIAYKELLYFDYI